MNVYVQNLVLSILTSVDLSLKIQIFVSVPCLIICANGLMVYSSARIIFHQLKLVAYLHVQTNK